ncbi:hypothetical protein PGT21_027715 [Puccinia graminis f. sp. tritici]|uniref:Uncharacterized protein n=1 Tax=Puccinia graminis f. sp. tritici TaxID=56615 RepID=A0A5B0MDU4_PUCGR|nr:hypothetical protein PGT21_027715 [Puccinia graminis f. sp. tritici]
MKETRLTDERSGVQLMISLDHFLQEKDTKRSAINVKPGEFKITVDSDQKWNKAFFWANKYLKQKKEKSTTIQNFMHRFEKEQQKLNDMLPFQHKYKKIELVDISIELIQTDCNQDEGIHHYIILPEGMRGSKQRRSHKSKSLGIRIEHIITASELFHRMSILHELDPGIFGTQWESSCKRFMKWLEEIFFIMTKDSLPLFGSLRDTWKNAEQSGKRFGSVHREISIVLARLKKPTYAEIFTLALSLLGYWYEMEVLKLGQSKKNGHPENLWKFLRSKKAWTDHLSRLKSPEQGTSKEQTWQQDMISVPFCNKDHDFFTCKMNEHFGNLKYVHYKGLELINILPKPDQSLVPQQTAAKIIELLTQYGNKRLQYLSQPIKKIKMTDFPIYIIPDFEYIDIKQEVLITLNEETDCKRRNHRQIELFENRIFKILESLLSLHKIASEILGEQMKNTQESLIRWFLDVLFENSGHSLPLFGFAEMVFPPRHDKLENLFGSPQKYLSKEFTTSRPLHENHANKIAYLLLGFWYENVLLKSDIFHSNDNCPRSYWDIFNQILESKKAPRKTS